MRSLDSTKARSRSGGCPTTWCSSPSCRTPRPASSPSSRCGSSSRTTGLIRAETINSVAHVELARPEKKNAITAEMYIMLADALAAADAELLLLGQPFSAQKAQEIGLVCEVVPAEQLFSKAGEAASMLAALPPESLRLTKRLLKKRHGVAIAEAIAEETRIFSERLSSPEAREAMSAFLEKRKPDFSRF